MRSRLKVVLESILLRTTMVVRLPTTPKRLTTSSATPSIQNCTPLMKLLGSDSIETIKVRVMASKITRVLGLRFLH